MKINIRLLSDAAIFSGDSVIDIIDNNVVVDTYGIPYIPSKRIKGVLREKANFIKGLYEFSDKVVDEIFNKIRIDNAKIKGYDQLITLYKLSENSDKYMKIINKDSYYRGFTVLRSQTQINEDGVAEEGSLRNFRTVKKGLEFEFDINGQLSDNEEDFIKKCCKITEHIGNGVTRGFGNVKFEIRDMEDNQGINSELDDFDNKNNQEQKSEKENNNEICKLIYKIELVDKCAISTDYISGTIIQGILTSLYSKSNSDQTKIEEIFLKDNVVFTNAYPSVDNIVSMPIPKAIIQDNIDDESIFGKIGNDGVEITKVNRHNYTHHRRNKNGNEVYYVSAIDTGTTFVGEIIENGSIDLNVIKKLIENNPNIFIGASKNCEYGRARITIIDAKEDTINTKKINTVILTSPMVVRNGYGKYSTKIEDVAATLGIPLGLVKNSNLREILIEGYNSKYQFKKEPIIALKEGSFIELKEETEINCNIYYGYNVSEGFGRIDGIIRNDGDKYTVTLNNVIKNNNLELKEKSNKTTVDDKICKTLNDKYIKKIFTKELIFNIFRCHLRESEEYKKIKEEINFNNNKQHKLLYINKTSDNTSKFLEQINKLVAKENKTINGDNTFNKFKSILKTDNSELDLGFIDNIIKDYKLEEDEKYTLFKIFINEIVKDVNLEKSIAKVSDNISNKNNKEGTV